MMGQNRTEGGIKIPTCWIYKEPLSCPSDATQDYICTFIFTGFNIIPYPVILAFRDLVKES